MRRAGVLRTWAGWLLLVAIGCAGSNDAAKGDADAGPHAGGGKDGGTFANADPTMAQANANNAMERAMPNPDAFWAMDPPPMQCLEDGSMGPRLDPPGGTPECPDDKHREGCACDNVGETASCWPGLRIHRGRGICEDGVTTCEESFEFGGRWGPCEGYTLPNPWALQGPGACRCFSMGTWELDNLSPCFWSYGVGTPSEATYALSTILLPSGDAECPSDAPGPPPAAPSMDWTTSRLTVDCAGHFELCFTIKAGNVSAPQPGDCELERSCVEVWYEQAGQTQELPALPGWASDDPACAERFIAQGGYGEMSVLGLSIECDPVDDGAGNEYVFARRGYCPAACALDPSLPECQTCGQGGAGDF